MAPSESVPRGAEARPGARRSSTRPGRLGPVPLFLLAVLAGLASLLAPPPPARAQGPEAALPVGFAVALNHSVRPTVELTGAVGSRRASLVASEVAGLVEEISAREGERVRRGAPLVRLRRETAELRLRAVRGQLDEARARLRLAEVRRTRARGLFEEKVISVQELDVALSEHDASRGRVEQLEAEVARLEDELERTVVRAPFDGVVVEEHSAPGEWIDAGGAVAEMIDVGDLEVDLEVPEQYFAGLARGEPVAVEILALAGESVEGKVRAVVPRANPQARTFPVKVSIPNREGRIGVGMLARVRLPIGAGASRVLVPKDAVVARGGERLVFVIGEGDRVRPVAVTTGQSQGAWIAVAGEVAAGDRVVTQGNDRLQPGQQVEPQPGEYEEP